VKPKGSIRRSQLITTYGVGAIVAVEDESYMIAGLDRWATNGPDLQEPRLERELRVPGFVLPPATEKGLDIPVVRFPTMLSCPSCKRLETDRFFATYEKNTCNMCDQRLIPSRFIVACRRSHIDDFPYFKWIHSGTPRTETTKHEMTIETAGNSASLRAVQLLCSCGKRATMEGSFGKHALQGVTTCTGRRPWLASAKEECAEIPMTLQRGASNVWFPVLRSSLSIPPWSEGAFKLLNKFWQMLRHLPDDALKPAFEGMHIAEGTPYSVADLVLAVQQRRRRENEVGPITDEAMKAQEYEALVKGRQGGGGGEEFVCVPAPELGTFVTQWFERVMVVKRLREVRVLESFTRLFPPSPADPPEYRGALFVDNPGWLPAMEVTGEGVFLQFKGQALSRWEKAVATRDRASSIDGNYARTFKEKGSTPPRTITARLLMLHTFAHSLINQWSLDSGYPASSLRERLYASNEMAGVLIYTATSDSAGSLGGVIAQADPGRLDASVQEALDRVSWCSADPLCSESVAAGVDSLNLAACHACILVPEVSCEEMNLLLDRGLLIGTPAAPTLGLFDAARVYA